MKVLVVWGVLLASLCAHAKDRVAVARKHQTAALVQAFRDAGLSWPPEELYLRAFKVERELEVWAGPRGKPLVKVRTYPICAASGDVGPKRAMGDSQVPEGFYTVDLFNPWSAYHLSMRVSYPNALDRKLGAAEPGGDIYIHGNCVSIGCLAMEDGPIEALYVLVSEARARMGRDVPVHIFPRRLDAAGLAALDAAVDATDARRAFWRGLEPGYRFFEEQRRPPRVKVAPSATAYVVTPALPAR
ncbi:L,D-transpeptidase family protein [Corallococcus sp. ZKHCc1 1396]|uniref:L,D-transpeptidase family protein n=1 Tax=Corallococcus soli TaxID=2710757 RepID=A0ABR9PTP4_9BACT|nr:MULTISPECIES: L,D-transpeptidase family protein [Corallococcus]MBE4751224.1 L,D-transpeptidase family protein [Corallococcus soli]MCY1033058.1 L,D-transpeptidase family protein [Corallococcus sp. BB11-1]